MTNRNYDIENKEINNRISFQPNTLFRVALNGRYSEKRNNSNLLNLKKANFDKLKYKFFYENYQSLMRTIYFEEFLKITDNQ